MPEMPSCLVYGIFMLSKSSLKWNGGLTMNKIEEVKGCKKRKDKRASGILADASVPKTSSSLKSGLLAKNRNK